MTRLDLPKGQWIEVKEEMTVADDDFKFGYASDGINQDGRVNFNVVRHNVARAAVRIVATSLDDKWPKAGPDVRRQRAMRVHALSSKVFDGIVKALDAYEQSLAEQEAEAEKKDDAAPGEAA